MGEGIASIIRKKPGRFKIQPAGSTLAKRQNQVKKSSMKPNKFDQT